MRMTIPYKDLQPGDIIASTQMRVTHVDSESFMRYVDQYGREHFRSREYSVSIDRPLRTKAADLTKRTIQLRDHPLHIKRVLQVENDQVLLLGCDNYNNNHWLIVPADREFDYTPTRSALDIPQVTPEA